jgi:hypothetical protein
MGWWSLYQYLSPLFLICENEYGVKIPTQFNLHFMKTMPDGTQQVASVQQYYHTLTYCPTPMMNYLLFAAAIGCLALLLVFCYLFVVVFARLLSAFPDLSEWFTALFHAMPREQTLADFMAGIDEDVRKQLNKAAAEYMKKSQQTK